DVERDVVLVALQPRAADDVTLVEVCERAVVVGDELAVHLDHPCVSCVAVLLGDRSYLGCVSPRGKYCAHGSSPRITERRGEVYRAPFSGRPLRKAGGEAARD